MDKVDLPALVFHQYTELFLVSTSNTGPETSPKGSGFKPQFSQATYRPAQDALACS